MRLRPWILPVAWMGIIFWGSTERFGAEATGSLILPLLRALAPWANTAQLEALHAVLRKTGHVLEYGILAWLWFRALSPSHWRAPAAFAISVAYAGLDELRQAWTGGRTGSVGDVLLDGVGAAAALGLLRFDWQAVVRFLATMLLWIAAAGGTLLLLLKLLSGVPGGWLWVSSPVAWMSLWVWCRCSKGPHSRV